MLRLLIIMLLTIPLSATVIVQKNGDVISGRILEERADKYIFQSPYGKLQIAKANVSKMILDEKKIELTEVKYKNTTVKARLVAEQDNTSVYLTDDGRTIRTESEPKPVEPVVKRDDFIVAFSGGYGWSTFQQVDTNPASAGSGMPPLEQGLHIGTLAFSSEGHYLLSSYWGIGAAGSVYLWKGSANLSAQPPQISYSSEIQNRSLLFSPSLMFSLLGNLGSQSAHDFRVEIHPGVSINAANLELALRNAAGNYPTTASASGNNMAFSLEGKISYLFPIFGSLRLKASFSYARIFHNGLYDTGLTGNTSFPVNDGFKNDFDAVLRRDATNPQILIGQLGVEYGF